MQISISIEAQEGLTWSSWKQIVAEVENLGYAGLFRSDHFPGDKAALELIVSLAYLADHTQRLHFGSLVAPLSFRDPAILAGQAAAIDDLSGGRLVLGLGAGWVEREHHVWGYQLGEPNTRSSRFKEGLEVISQLLNSDEPVTYEGQYYQLRGARLLPRPQRSGGPAILIGGNGVRLTLPLVARYADVWNVFHVTPDIFRERSAVLDNLLRIEGRQPSEVKRTMMAQMFCGRNESELKQRADFAYRNWVPELSDRPFDNLLEALDSMISPLLNSVGATFCPLVGTPDEVVDQIDAYEEAGVQELILQWFDPDDVEGLQMYSEFILPRLEA
jgi:alkanesulfonate monooxygenase SsuD/methylene tetrahydromethanopterin reductase-like flavin-dependent oxidoreductase (luciferase family)